MKKTLFLLAFLFLGFHSFAYAENLRLKIPASITTAPNKTEYAYRVQELLRAAHNFIGGWYREGITEPQYNNLPAFIKNRIAYTPKLTKTQWEWFLENIYVPRSQAVTDAILSSRKNLKNSTVVSIVDLENDFEAVI